MSVLDLILIGNSTQSRIWYRNLTVSTADLCITYAIFWPYLLGTRCPSVRYSTRSHLPKCSGNLWYPHKPHRLAQCSIFPGNTRVLTNLLKQTITHRSWRMVFGVIKMKVKSEAVTRTPSLRASKRVPTSWWVWPAPPSLYLLWPADARPNREAGLSSR